MPRSINHPPGPIPSRLPVAAAIPDARHTAMMAYLDRKRDDPTPAGLAAKDQ